MLILKLFGTPSIEASAGPVTGRAAQGRRLALLATLALARGRAISRDKLIALLWPESPTERARPQLSDTLYIVRAALGDDVVRSTGDELVLNADAITSDAESFERRLDQGQHESAVELYAGPLLDGFHLSDCAEFEHWLDAERARFGQRYAAALESVAEASEARGEVSVAVKWWRKLATNDPYSGHVALRLMRALDTAGDRAGALKHARIHAALLREEFEAEPDAEVMAFAEQLRIEPPARSAPQPAATQSAPSRPQANAVPAPITSATSRKRPARRYAIAAVAIVLVVFGVYGIQAVRPKPPGARSLGVMPFVNMSSDPENTYFSDGLSEQIISALSHIDGLRVAARTSSFALRDTKLDVRAIGDTLGVDAVLEGSVRKDGLRLRVSAQLIDATSGYHIWSEEYDRELKDIIAVQDDIARAIAGALELRFPGRRAAARARRVSNLEAYDLYLRGLYLRNSLTADGLQQGIEFLDRAIELEPDFAAAYAAKASVIAPRVYFRYMPWQQGVNETRAAITRALELDPTLAEAYASLGILKLFFEWDWQGAERALHRALELNPSDSHTHHHLANYLHAMMRFDEAVGARERAVALDPLNARPNIVLSVDYFRTGRLDKALAQYERAVKLDPVNPLVLGLGPALPSGPVRVYLKQGRYAQAVEELIKVATLRGATASELDALRNSFARSGMPGFWRNWLDMDLRQSGSSPDPLRIAVLWTLIGDTHQACNWLERAYKDRNPALIYVRSEFGLDNLRSQPCFTRIVQEMKFPEP